MEVVIVGLKEWNVLQCQLFKKYGVADAVLIYKVASAIGYLKTLPLEEAVPVVEKIIKEMVSK